MKYNQLLIILVLLLLFTNKGTSLKYKKFELNYANVGHATALEFSLQLENNLSQKNYVRIILPQSLASPSCQFVEILENCYTSFPRSLRNCNIEATTLASDGAVNAYFLNQFEDTNGDTMDLASGQVYKIVIYVGASLTQQSQPQEPIQIMTVSDHVENFITFEKNNVFSNLYIASAPTNTLISTCATCGSYAQSTTQTISFSVTPTLNNASGIIVELSNDLFEFILDTCTTSSLTDYTCAVEEPQRLFIMNGSILSTGTTYSFTIDVNFPNYADSTDLTFYTMYGDSQQALEYFVNNNALVSNAYTFTNQNLYLGWGMQISGQGSSNGLFGIFKNDASDNPVYNSLEFQFEVSDDLQEQEYKLIFQIGDNAYILQNSLQHNFPQFDTNSEIICEITDTPAEITCTNVGQFITTQTYSIKIKVQFLNAFDNFTGDGVNFGKVNIYPVYQDGTTHTSVSVTADNSYATTNISILTNNFRTSLSSTNNYQGAYTKASQFDLITVDGPQVKYKGAGAETLEFLFTTIQSDFTSSGTMTNVGFDIYASNQLLGIDSAIESPSYPSTNCYSGTSSTPSFNYCYAYVSTFFGTSVLNLRNGFSGHANAVSAFTSTTGFGFYQVEVLRLAGLYSDLSLDFYIGMTDSISSTQYNGQSIYQSVMLLNSFIVPSPTDFDNLQVSISNFWIGSTTNYISGNEFPAIIRLNGYLSASEASDITQIIVFFDQLNTFDDIENDQQTSCTSTLDVQIQCKFYEGDLNTQHFWDFRRTVIEGDFSSYASVSDKFEAIIPVQTVGGQDQLSLFLGGVNSDMELVYVSQFYEFDFSSFSVSTEESLSLTNKNQFINLQGQNYAINSDGYAAGSVQDTYIYLYHNDYTSTFDANDGTNEGAAFTITGKWNFYESPTFQVDQTNAGIGTTLGTNENEKCLTFAYSYPSDIEYPYRYNLFCPIQDVLGDDETSVINITGLTLPYNIILNQTEFKGINGIKMPHVYSVLSNNNGYLLKFDENYQEDMIANDLILSDISLSFDLYQGKSSLRPYFLFTTTNDIPQSFTVKITCYECIFNFKINLNYNSQSGYQPCLLKNSSGQEISMDSCYISFNGSEIQANIEIQEKQEAGDFQLQIKGVDVLDFPVSYQEYNMGIYSNEGHIIDETSDLGQIYYEFTENIMSIGLSDLKFFIPHKGAKTIFSFQMNLINRQVFEDDQIILNLDIFTYNNPSYVMNILIKDVNNNNEFSDAFSSCEIDPTDGLAKIILTPNYDLLDQNQSYLVEFHDIYVPITDLEYGISIELRNAFDELILYDNDVILPDRNVKFQMILSSLVLQQKYQNVQGGLSELHFTLKPQNTGINVNSFIYVYFPYYYPDDFGLVEPYCEIDTTFTRCEFIYPRLLTVRDIPFEFDEKTVFDLSIYGLPIPEYSTAGTFFFAFDNDNDPTEVKEFGEIDDFSLASVATLNTIYIENFWISDLTWIVQNNYIFEFYLDGALTVNSRMIIDLPYSWADKNQFKEDIKCYIGGTQTTSCDQIGHQISFPIDFNLAASTTYQITIENIRNPHHTDCIFEQPMFSLQDQSDQEKILARSYPQLTNLGIKAFTEDLTNPTLWKREIIYKDENIDGEDNIYDMGRYLDIHRSTYSPRIRISLANDKRVDRDVQITFQESLNDLVYFKLYPENVVIETGEYFVDLRIGVLPNVTAGSYSLYFDTIQDRDTYYDLPPGIVLEVTEDKLIIPALEIQPVKLPIEGYSLHLCLDLDSYPPYNELTIQSLIPIYPDLRLDFGYVSDYDFSVSDPFYDIYIVSDEQPTLDDRQTELQFLLEKEDSAYFEFEQSEAIIELQDDLPDKAVIDLELVDKSSTTASFAVVSTELTTIFYQVTLDSSLIEHDFIDTFQQVRQHYLYNYFDTDQLQYGMYQINTKDSNGGVLQNSDANFQIKNLFSNSKYRVTFWSQDLAHRLNKIKTMTFTTEDNGDTYFKVQIKTEEQLEDDHLSAVICGFCYTFQYSIQRIRSPKEIICDPDILGGLSPPSSSESSEYYIYFYKHQNREMVERADIFYEVSDLKANNNLNTYLTEINTFINQYGIGDLKSIKYMGTVQINKPVISKIGDVTTQPYSINFSDFQLVYNGFIWGIAQKLSLSIKGRVEYTGDPSFEQVRQGLDYDDSIAISSIFEIQHENGDNLDFTFENLDDDSYYRLVFYFQSEDPSDYKQVGQIFTVEFETPLNSLLKIFTLKLFIVAFLTVIL
ncbi:hypothetical protein PPERSA_01561 [Pseudocohnilembus persalinus]|uniref:Cadherin-like protein n=1 Tax=Pseudocohnilembus persalinus TaxID=266149 RepID=A0A0V0QHT5_PSEPJ|nr:hypothetical protein PPERSA_01561 [Pseudocohnilembus persalinus]|eukprot:KRX01691.1 hypothetical protein PPERSA_01561 [Pseudocohnilembus persalinus]